MKILILLTWTLFAWTDILNINVPVSEFEMSDNGPVIRNATYMNIPGAPHLTKKVVTIALPPGAVVEQVNFSGKRIALGTCSIPPTPPNLPLMDNQNLFEKVMRSYQLQKNKFYQSNQPFPQDYGRILSIGGLRKYTVVTVVCYHFSYRPLTEQLYYSPEIAIEIRYRMPSPGTRRARFWQKLRDDTTFDEIARKIVYNWQEAKTWYRTTTPKRANGYYIIIPASIQHAVDTLVAYRQSQGYNVNVITKEYIEANIPGIDLQQKIRNYLRQNLTDIEYVLLVGFIDDIPWRNMVPFNDDPDSPYNDPNISPIPSDLYYAELSEPDSLSWNYDRDTYYGEVFDSLGQPNGDDLPDYHADIHLGRIPFSTDYVIEDICAKMVGFDSNTDISYKTASLLPAGIYYYGNENNSGNSRLDGASFTQELLDEGILDSTNTITLYEQAGLRPSLFPCTDSLCRTNHIMYWQNRGIVYECHHGNYNCYARKIWSWDDGDSIPENNEMDWPNSLQSSDVYSLDNSHPATTFLRSCLCGKPEVYSLGAYLLYRGASSVISSSRIAWLSLADEGGIPYHFYKRLMQDTTISHSIIGNAYDIARNDFMDIAGHWMIAYHYNLFGDPGLRQFGRITDIKETKARSPSPRFAVFPNPSSGKINLILGSNWRKDINLDVYDVRGRFLKTLYKGDIEVGFRELKTGLPSGIYFFKLTSGDITVFEKVVIIN